MNFYVQIFNLFSTKHLQHHCQNIVKKNILSLNTCKCKYCSYLWNMRATKSPRFDQIDPRTCVNGKLRKLHRLINSAYMKNLKPFGLRGSMLSILFIIGKRPGVNQKTIADTLILDTLILDQSTMSRDLKKLIDNQWVIKKRGKDSRHKELKLTDEGIQLLENVTPVWKRMHHTVEEILGKHNIQQIDLITAAIRENLNEIKN